MSTQSFVCGVDPGKTGAVALLSLEDNSLKFVGVPLIGTNVDVPRMLAELREVGPSVARGVMEDVHSIFGASAKSNFQFGWINGLMECMLYASGIPFTKVQPKAWQALAWAGIDPVSVPTGKKHKKTGKPMYKVDTKATSLLVARRLFPDESFLATARSSVPHDGRVDAALMAYYAKVKLLAC